MQMYWVIADDVVMETQRQAALYMHCAEPSSNGMLHMRAAWCVLCSVGLAVMIL